MQWDPKVENCVRLFFGRLLLLGVRESSETKFEVLGRSGRVKIIGRRRPFLGGVCVVGVCGRWGVQWDPKVENFVRLFFGRLLLLRVRESSETKFEVLSRSGSVKIVGRRRPVGGIHIGTYGREFFYTVHLEKFVQRVFLWPLGRRVWIARVPGCRICARSASTLALAPAVTAPPPPRRTAREERTSCEMRAHIPFKRSGSAWCRPELPRHAATRERRMGTSGETLAKAQKPARQRSRMHPR